MYIPRAFAETDQQKLVQIMRENSFAILFSTDGDRSQATHLPLLIDVNEDRVLLSGHFAKANPHWHEIENEEVLVVFSGPHAYISPTWYEAENTVPTWNYIAVHAYGRLTLMRDEQALLSLLERLTDFYEAAHQTPWKFDASQEFYQKLAGGVVGFTIEVTHLEGKQKLNQNHPQARQQRVVTALQSSDSQNDRAIAALMADNLD